jgi:hypothetical protein
MFVQLNHCIKEHSVNVELVKKAVYNIMMESLQQTSSGMLTEGMGIRYADLLNLLVQENCVMLFSEVFERVLDLELQYWTLFTNLEYNSLVIETLFSNMMNFTTFKNPQIIGKMIAKRPMRTHLVAAIRGTHILKRLREESEALEANLELAIVLHKQLIYYPLEFPDAEKHLDEFYDVLIACGNDKAAGDIKTEILMF